MSRWPLPDRLNLLLVAAVLFTAWGPLCFNSFDGPHGPGRDMIQFYTAGTIVNAGQADQLYDQDFFQEAQRPLIGDTIAWHSLYSSAVGACWRRPGHGCRTPRPKWSAGRPRWSVSCWLSGCATVG